MTSHVKNTMVYILAERRLDRLPNILIRMPSKTYRAAVKNTGAIISVVIWMR